MKWTRSVTLNLFVRCCAEAYSPLPHDQHDSRNLPRQRQTRHLWSHPFGQQDRVELLEGVRLA